MTKPRSIRIQFYLLVPLIFAGFTALAAQLTYHLMRSGAVAAGRTWPLLATAGLLVATAFLSLSALPVDPSLFALLIARQALLGTLRLVIYLLIGALILQAVLSWVNPYSPLGPVVHQFTRPLLAPIQRFVPPIANIDLSPLVAILALQLVLIFV